MSEQNTAQAGEQNEQGQEQANEFAAITSQADFDTAIQARIARERAKFADYDEVKAAAGRLTDIENANKTENERQLERTAELERENAELKSAKTRSDVAASKGVPAELLSGSTQADLELSADALIAFRGEQGSNRLLVPNEGKSPTKQPSTESEFVASLFGLGD